MQTLQIIHNPTAGKADHSKAFLINLVKGFSPRINYISTKDDAWKAFEFDGTDLVFLAGGDGTVRKVFEKVLLKKEKGSEKVTCPVVLLPFGTANNIARTLNIFTDPLKMIAYGEEDVERYNYGDIEGLKEKDFFIESAGFGIFPELLSVMKNSNIYSDSPGKKMELALEQLISIVKDFKPEKIKIKTGGITIKGSFLLTELMKIKHIGPNVELAPEASVSDEYFHLVLIPEEKRKALETYLTNTLENKEEPGSVSDFVMTLRVKSVKIKSGSAVMHVDDELVKDYSGKYIRAEVRKGTIPFIKNIRFS